MKDKKELTKTIFFLDSWEGDIHCPKCGSCLISQARDGKDELLECPYCDIFGGRIVTRLTFLDKLDKLLRKWYICVPVATACFYLAGTTALEGLDINNFLEMMIFIIFGLDILLFSR